MNILHYMGLGTIVYLVGGLLVSLFIWIDDDQSYNGFWDFLAFLSFTTLLFPFSLAYLIGKKLDL